MVSGAQLEPSVGMGTVGGDPVVSVHGCDRQAPGDSRRRREAAAALGLPGVGMARGSGKHQLSISRVRITAPRTSVLGANHATRILWRRRRRHYVRRQSPVLPCSHHVGVCGCDRLGRPPSASIRYGYNTLLPVAKRESSMTFSGLHTLWKNIKAKTQRSPARTSRGSRAQRKRLARRLVSCAPT